MLGELQRVHHVADLLTLRLGDDNVLLRFDVSSDSATQIAVLEGEATTFDATFQTKGQNELLVVGYANGEMKIINKFGKVEKAFEAHKGAVTCVKWSHDGQTIASCGEEGTVKIYSKNGQLRTELLKLDQAAYCVDWNSDDDHIVCGSGKMVHIKPLQPSQRDNSWKAHDNGCVLKIDWNVQNDMLLTTGEDCKYKIWNSDGILLYSSSSHDYCLTSIAWAPNGQYFCVGSFNMIKLCDKSGWSHIMHELDKGSVMDICWNPDSMLVSMATVTFS